MGGNGLGRYTGRLVLHPLVDGRRMRVLEDFGYFDPKSLHWAVPPNTIVDGASIPRPLWSLIGGPWVGKYRDASVVHDYYCDVRTADWRSVHRMFYHAMLTSGVSLLRAKLMYAAVRHAGPRWSETATANVKLRPPISPQPGEPQGRPARGRPAGRISHPTSGGRSEARLPGGNVSRNFQTGEFLVFSVGQRRTRIDPFARRVAAVGRCFETRWASRSDVLHLDRLERAITGLRMSFALLDEAFGLIDRPEGLSREIQTGSLKALR